MTEHTLELHGCTPVPLAGYLKALGVLRIVSEQIDDDARGWWERGVFHLRSSQSEDELLAFFLNDYSPTPIVGPWGARSGFYAGQSEKSARAALESIESTVLKRLKPFRTAISETRKILKSHEILEKPEPGKPKDDLMRLLRAEMSDSQLDWLDCVFVLLDDGTAFPPILGTGGNEGSGSYTSGFSQAVVEVIADRKWDGACSTSLFDIVQPETTSNQSAGHFFPDATGGPNAGSGYLGRSTLNPWTLLWLMEGTLAFASSCSKRAGTDARESATFPFSVDAAGVGYGSASLADEASRRRELWLPIWESPSTYAELSHLFAEGRATLDRRPAKSATDFARAISSLGTDRRITAFERYGFQLRNGDLSNFAIHLGRHRAGRSDRVRLLSDLDRNSNWLDRFRRAATGQHAPGRAASTLRRLETAVLEVCQRPGHQSAQQILISLGEAEAAIAISPKLREADYPVPPVPLLDAAWLKEAYDQSATTHREFRLAAALASLGYSRGERVGPVRRHLEPINYDRLTGKSRRAMWAAHADDPSIVWSGGNLIRNLILVLERRLIDAVKGGNEKLVAPFDGRCPALPSDIFHFIEGNVDDNLIESLMRGLMLIDWNAVNWSDLPQPVKHEYTTPSAAYCLLKLCLLPCAVPTADGAEIDVKLSPQIARRAATGDLAGATELAARRLQASGLRPAVDVITARREIADRTAAALVFPLRHDPKRKRSSVTLLRDRVIRKEQHEESDEPATEVSSAT
ncbi:MAG: type I-U CRISPR-associated protein Csx17 [Planctomycetota bacterium]|nr:type I-U CRISPR-associated protein Csx17 [Planctomycetota bacterium]